MTIELKHDQPIRAAAWGPGVYATAWTLKGYCEETARDYHKALEQAQERGHKTVSAIYVGSTLLGHGEASEARRVRDLAAATSAVTLKDGDEVLIDGARYVARFVHGNEYRTAPVNSDPVIFYPKKET